MASKAGLDLEVPLVEPALARILQCRVVMSQQLLATLSQSGTCHIMALML